MALLRPGKRPSGAEAARIIAHVTKRIRKSWPRVRILWRGDSHYATPEALDCLEALDCSYVLGLAGNRRLKAMASPGARTPPSGAWPAPSRRSGASTKPPIRPGHGQARRVIAPHRGRPQGADQRFIVTNLQGRAKRLYDKVYCARGQAENLIKDIKTYTASDRTSCHRWQANQFRLFLHMGAYWLLHGLRRFAPRKSPWRGATFATLRATFLKIAARIEELKSRVTIALPCAYPHKAMLAFITAKACPQGPDQSGKDRSINPSPEKPLTAKTAETPKPLHADHQTCAITKPKHS